MAVIRQSLRVGAMLLATMLALLVLQPGATGAVSTSRALSLVITTYDSPAPAYVSTTRIAPAAGVALSRRVLPPTNLVAMPAGSLPSVSQFGVAAETEGGIFRGVASSHPGYEDALQGRALPRSPDGLATAEEHNLGNTAESPFTSRTHNLDVAKRFAGDDGVVLRLPQGPPPEGAAWKFEWSPDNWFENEILIRGPVSGAQVLVDD